MYETALVSVNDYFVSKFLNKRITYKRLIQLINKYAHYKDFLKFRKIRVKNVDDIYKIRNYVSLKLDTLGI